MYESFYSNIIQVKRFIDMYRGNIALKDMIISRTSDNAYLVEK